MKIDQQGWESLATGLQQEGWTGSLAGLKRLFSVASAETDVRTLDTSWSSGEWGQSEKCKKFVFSLIACARRRGAKIAISQYWETNKFAPELRLLFANAPSGLQAMYLEVRLDGSVHVARKFDGDWRSTRTFLKSGSA
jgi:hypothetical protein